jgi:hypothetical protein
VVDVTVEWGFKGLAELVVAFASAIALSLTMSKEFTMSFCKNIVCVGAALMPAWWKAPYTSDMTINRMRVPSGDQSMGGSIPLSGT